MRFQRCSSESPLDGSGSGHPTDGPRNLGRSSLLEWVTRAIRLGEATDTVGVGERMAARREVGEAMRWLNNTDLLVAERAVFRQVGWLGQSGTFYPLNRPPNAIMEPGSFAPIYQQLDQ